MDDKEFYKNEYIKLKIKATENLGFDESDLCDEDIENLVKSKTDDEFENKFHFEYSELID